MANRRIHLGIDYGTSTSKIVLMDYGAPGGRRARALMNEAGSCRLPSTVLLDGVTLRFGVGTGLTSARAEAVKSHTSVTIYESLKMRVAAEAKGHLDAHSTALPHGLSAADLATITVARLIEKGAEAARAEHGNGLKFGMTLGVPMSFLADMQLRSVFLRIARTAWHLWRSDALRSDELEIEKVRQLLTDAHAVVDASSVSDIRDWIRSEAEAAMWWTVQSPSVRAGAYAKVDVGAGTTNASVFRIGERYSDGAWIKDSLRFFGAKSEGVGMDAIDTALAACCGLPSSLWFEMRGREEQLLSKQPKTRRACEKVLSRIRRVFEDAWMRGYSKYRASHPEVEKWEKACVFAIGGGSLVSAIREKMREHPQNGPQLRILNMECPSDLELGTGDPHSTLPFLNVAYGLSTLTGEIREVESPDEIGSIPDDGDRLARLNHEDVYAK